MEWNVPWATKLRAAYKENYKTDARNRDRLRGTSRGAKDGAETCGTGHLHTCTPTTTGRPVLASQRTDGSAKAQSIPFLDFLRSDPRVLLFAAAARNQELMSVVKINQTHELHWQMPTTDETYIFSGKAFVVCSPTLSHRFGSGPRNIQLPDPLPVFPANNPFPPTPDDFWQSERDRLWRELSSSYRATWTWPNPGEPRNSGTSSNTTSLPSPTSAFAPSSILERTSTAYRNSSSSLSSPTTASFKCTSLEAMATTGSATTAVGTGKKASNDDEATRALHMAAFDNFCVLVFRVLKVEHQFVGSDKLPGKENQN